LRQKTQKPPIGSNIPTEALNKPFQLTTAHGKTPDRCFLYIKKKQSDSQGKKYHNVAVGSQGHELHITCQHIEFSLYQKESRCTVDMLSLR